MLNYLILHGHFYQPPREIPSTGLIPLQRSASPYHDWNTRIAKECYGANSASRILDKNGLIIDIINNYEFISFNIGPTLIDWLQEYAPNVYERILEADRKSIEENNGHGNALAQGFNHTILPLDSKKDAELEIFWGIQNFKRHFGRNPEGFWLPEAAVNMDVVDILIEYRIKFIILSPQQADSIQSPENKKWHKVKPGTDISGKPYLLHGKKGSITVFFYNKFLSEGISFNHFLRNADTLYQTLTKLAEENPGSLIHTASDGEIYGHHEPYGDMCLAALSRRVEGGGKLKFTNYGYYLEEHPPVLEVQLKGGEGNKGTSWSCFHGVSRWYKDCGCTTGGKPGWNQRWRTPLRDAFNYLSRELLKVFEAEMGKIARISPQKTLFGYERVLNGTIKPEDYAREILIEPSDEGTVKALSLLEGQVNRLYMFTSCGWFFADISGLEPLQDMRYSSEALRLYKNILPKHVKHSFLDILGKAESNVPEKKTGKELFESIESKLPEGFEAALYFCTNQDKKVGKYGIFKLEGLKNNGSVFSATVKNTKTTEVFTFDISLPVIGMKDPDLKIKSHGIVLKKLTDIPFEIRNALFDCIESKISTYTPLEIVFVFKLCSFLAVPVPKSINGDTITLISTLLKENLENREAAIPDSVYADIREMIRLSNHYSIDFDRTIPQNILMGNLKNIKKKGITTGPFYRQTMELCSIMGIYTGS